MLRIVLAGLLLLAAPAEEEQSLTVSHQGKTIASAHREPFLLPVAPFLDANRLQRFMRSVEQSVSVKPKNATIGDAGQIVPEAVGSKLNRSRFTDYMFAYLYGSGPMTFAAPVMDDYPRVDSELLADIREKPIGYYVTYFNTGNKPRAHNIALAAKALDNVVVFPGELFSFNETVGMRTEGRGYQRAPIIVRGELAEGIGGGICQVSSTLFNATDRAGLQIVQRYSHSRHVHYVLAGRDATVSWGGPDFRFRNPYHQPILLRTFAGNGAVTVSIYSSDRIEYKPREVPGMTETLPEETSEDRNAARGDQGYGNGATAPPPRP